MRSGRDASRVRQQAKDLVPQLSQREGLAEKLATGFRSEALRQLVEAPMLANEREEYDRELALLKAELDAGAFQNAWIAGGHMDLDQAVDFALAGPQPGVS